MKQIGLAALMYVQDYDEKFAPNRIWHDGGTHSTWRCVVMPYMKNDTLFLCPSAPRSLNVFYWDLWSGPTGCVCDVSMTRADFDANPRRMKGQANYGVNGDVFNANGRYVVGLAQFDRPASTILILETRDFWPDLGTWTFGWNYDQGGGSLPFWHSKGGNYTFADGHTKFFRLQQTINANGFMWNLSNDPNTDCQRVAHTAYRRGAHMTWWLWRTPFRQPTGNSRCRGRIIPPLPQNRRRRRCVRSYRRLWC